MLEGPTSVEQASGLLSESPCLTPSVGEGQAVAELPQSSPERMINGYELLREIGSGTYGTVFAAHGPEGDVAIKQMSLETRDEGVPVVTIREVALLLAAVHPHIVAIREVISRPPHIFMVIDRMDFDLKWCLDTRYRHGMPHLLVQSCMLQIFSALAHCHERLILHRDLKPHNVLVDKQGLVKVADFGMARVVHASKPYTQPVVTLWYRAPEILETGENADYGAPVDLWSTGCILAELASGRPLFPGDSEINQLRCIGHSTPLASRFPRLSVDLHGLLDSLTKYKPDERLDAKGAMAHAFFDDVRGRSLPLEGAAFEPPSASTV